MATHLLRPARVGCIFAIALRRFRRVLWSAVLPAWSLSRKASGRRVRAKTIVAIAGDRWFESSSLQRRVSCELTSGRYGRRDSTARAPVLTGSWRGLLCTAEAVVAPHHGRPPSRGSSTCGSVHPAGVGSGVSNANALPKKRPARSTNR
jgi:hypothetical protein